jgi:hypothetical protein
VLALGTANADGHSLPATTRHFAVVANGGGAPITVTVQTTATVKGRDVDDDEITVDDGDTVLIGPFDPLLHGQEDGTAHLDLSTTSSVTVAVFELPASAEIPAP